MNPVLEGLLPSFRDQVEALTEKLTVYLIRYRLIQGYRSPLEQAKLWRQGRSGAIIQTKMMELSAKGEHTIARLLTNAGRQDNPNIVTKALPFCSPHQFRCALDLVPYSDGSRLLWDEDQRDPDVESLWRTCGELGKECGLEWGGDWRYFKDSPHYQHPQYEKKKARLYRMALANPNITADEIERVLNG